MMVKVLTFVALAMLPLMAMGARYDIPDGDYQELIEAFEQANTTDETDIITLARNGTYVRPNTVPGWLAALAVETPIVVEGNGATLIGAEFKGSFFQVEPTGQLWLNDINILDSSRLVGSVASALVLQNEGRVWINRSTIGGGNWNGALYGSRGIVWNLGELVIRNSTLSGNSNLGANADATLTNYGNAVIENVLFTDNDITEEGAAIMNGGTATVRNTVFWANTSRVYDVSSNCTTDFGEGGLFISLGGNFDSDSTCELVHASDLIGVDPLLGPLADNGGPTLTHLPATDSPVVDAGKGALRIDQRGLHRVGKRDSGAVELGGVPGLDIGPWATGTWFVPKEDGHYFVVEVINSNLVVAYWLTFDDEGNQQWVYAAGKPDGSRVFLEAHVSEGMRPPGFGPNHRVQTSWGALELHFKDCNNAWAEWHTGQPGFVSDTTPLRRLTAISASPCASDSGADFFGHTTAQWTGTWHVPSKDGHYFTVQGIDSQTVLVYWLTYDETRSPRWVYAVGTPVNDVMVADAYIVHGLAAPDFASEDLEQRLWGTLEFEFRNCGRAFANWQTNEPGFFPGSATLSRLTAVQGVGCD